MSEEQEEAQDPFLSFKQGMNQVAQGLSQAFQEIMAGMLPIAQAIQDAVWERYREVGMPYGDNQDGLMHWMKDMGEIMQHQQSIERIQQRHDTLIHARKLGERIRAMREREEGLAQDVTDKVQAFAQEESLEVLTGDDAINVLRRWKKEPANNDE